MLYWNMIVSGGPVMWLIVLCSLLALYIFIGKWFQFHRAQVNVQELISGLVNVLRRDGMIEAITLCDNTPGPVARILTAAIQAYQNDDDIRQAIDDAALVELPRLESRMNILATISKVAPMLGLLGTVVGMAETFIAMQMKQGISLSTVTIYFLTRNQHCIDDDRRRTVRRDPLPDCLQLPCQPRRGFLRRYGKGVFRDHLLLQTSQRGQGLR